MPGIHATRETSQLGKYRKHDWPVLMSTPVAVATGLLQWPPTCCSGRRHAAVAAVLLQWPPSCCSGHHPAAVAAVLLQALNINIPHRPTNVFKHPSSLGFWTLISLRILVLYFLCFIIMDAGVSLDFLMSFDKVCDYPMIEGLSQTSGTAGA